MTIKEHLALAGRYLLQRLQEPSTYRGLILVVSAGAWNRLDGSNKGELIMQGGLLLAGLIQSVLPQSTLYKPRKGRE